MQFLHPRTLAAVPHSTLDTVEGAEPNEPTGNSNVEAAPAFPTTTNNQTQRYCHDVHGPLIMDACGGSGSVAMTNTKEKRALAVKLKIDYKALGRGLAKRIATGDLKQRKD